MARLAGATRVGGGGKSVMELVRYADTSIAALLVARNNIQVASCLRCINADRVCGGYEDSKFAGFRLYEAISTISTLPLPFMSSARKCSLPQRSILPGTDEYSRDALPPEITQGEGDIYALRAFFYDFCIERANPNMSKGFLSGLEMVAYRQGPKSDLVKACQAVACVTHGKPLNRPHTLRRGALIHQELLGSLARAIQNPTAAATKETRFIAMLLGLYQISESGEVDRGSHETHAKGLAAIMHTGTSPLHLLGKVLSSTTTFSRTLKISGAFSVPALNTEGVIFDDLLLGVNSLWARFSVSSSPSDLARLMKASIALDNRFAAWSVSRATEFKPTQIAIVNLPFGLPLAVGYWPGKITTYFDLYIAGVWNIFRAARLLLVGLRVKLSAALGQDVTCNDHVLTATSLVEEMFASIPYHLTDNLQAFVSQLPGNSNITDPGKYLGGLLLMHPLYVVKELPFLPLMMRDYARDCLTWIGLNMGFGHALMMARTSSIDRDFLASGCMIIWSGFLD